MAYEIRLAMGLVVVYAAESVTIIPNSAASAKWAQALIARNFVGKLLRMEEKLTVARRPL